MVEINLFKHATDAVTMSAGAVLFRDGEPGDVMYAVIEGRVELTHKGVVLDDIGPGGVVGEMALIDHEARSATATAQTDVRVVRIDEVDFTHLVQDHPTFALQVMAVMAERIRKINDLL